MKGRKPAFTPKQAERMQQMHDEGLPCVQIARIMNTSKTTVGVYLRSLKNANAKQ